MKLAHFACAAALGFAMGFAPASAMAADALQPSIAITTSGSVQYAPDIAHISLGVRAQSPSASEAAALVNTRAQAVVKALRALGISDADIKTSGYSLDFQQNDNSAGVNTMGGPMSGEMHRPIAAGYYVGSESIDVTVPVSRAGVALDGAVKAGANQANGLWYDTSQRDRLYRQALAAALMSAHQQAVALASAAGVQLGKVLSISTGGNGPTPLPMMNRVMMATANAPAPPVQGGTDTIEASVSVVFAIRQ